MNWDCHNCTLCCRLFALGPVDPTIVAGLEARDVGQDWAPAAGGWYHETPDGFFLDHVDDSCVFLRPDGMCAVHALYGPEAKPAFCRTFPFTLVEQPGGTVHAVREDCGGSWRSQAEGTPVAEAIAALPADAPRLRWGDDPVLVLPGVGLAADDWLTLEDHLIASLDDTLCPRQNLRTVRDTLLGALRRQAPPGDPSRADRATQALRQQLLGALGPAASAPSQAGTSARFLAGVTQGLQAARPGAPLPPLEPDACRYFAEVLRQQLRGKSFLSQGGVCWGLGLWSLGVELARSRTSETALAELAPWHVRWSRFTRNASARSLLHHHRSLAWDAVLYR